MGAEFLPCLGRINIFFNSADCFAERLFVHKIKTPSRNKSFRSSTKYTRESDQRLYSLSTGNPYMFQWRSYRTRKHAFADTF